MAPPHLCTEDSQAVLEPSPAVLNDLLNLIPVWWSSSILAPRFPGEDRAGKLGRVPPTTIITAFLIVFPMSFVLLAQPHTLRLPSPLLTVREPGWPLFFARKSSLR